MAERDDWILSSTNNLLEGQKINFGNVANWGGVDKRAALRNQFVSQTGVNFWNGKAGNISPSQSAAMDKFNKSIGFSGSSYGDAFYSAGANEKSLTAVGYKPPTVNRTSEMKSKYGNSFTDEQIQGALTGRYGEVQGNADLGKGWEELYQSMDKWQQQDAMWYEQATGVNDELFPKAIAEQKAKMAAGGMKQGTALWNSNIDNLNNQRLDVEGTYQQKQQALQESQTYKALENQYNELKDTKSLRGKESTRTRYASENVYHEATRKWQGAKYGRDSETGNQIEISPGAWIDTPAYNETVQTPYQETYQQTTKTNDLAYGVEGNAPTFDEFWQQNFDRADNVDNPYTDRDISNQPESETDRRARLSASGAAME